MENYSLVRIAARELRAKIDPDFGELDANAILAKALVERSLTLEELPASDSTLAGSLGVYNRKYGLVAVSLGLDPRTRLEVIAHEIGHNVVHQAEVSQVSADYGTAGPGDPVLRVEAYGVRERREAQANVFARELLLPRVLARRLFLQGMRASEIVSRTGLSPTLIYQQLTDALLLPEPSAPSEAKAATFKALDKSQEAAADHRGMAFLLEAGPGLGKRELLSNGLYGSFSEARQSRTRFLLSLSPTKPLAS